MQIATRRLPWALLLFHALGGMTSAQDLTTMSRVPTAPAAGDDTRQVSCSPEWWPSLPRLQIEIAFDGPPMPPKLATSAMTEVTLIWAEYGVDVHASNPIDVRRDSAVRLAVRLADHPDRPLAPGALGSIVFRDGAPQPRIAIYPKAIAALVSTVKYNGTDDRTWPTALHELIVGRVLGRALAHEIGHFLLRSRYHAETGLMRVTQLVPDLVAPERNRFGLSRAEVARLVSNTSTCLETAPPAARPGGASSR